jgi:hypothetical protein
MGCGSLEDRRLVQIIEPGLFADMHPASTRVLSGGRDPIYA